jgi:hypothetical protein
MNIYFNQGNNMGSFIKEPPCFFKSFHSFILLPTLLLFLGVFISKVVASEIVWDSLIVPDTGICQVISLDTLLFARNDSSLFLSKNLGYSWSRIWKTPNNKKINDMDISNSNVYIATNTWLYFSTSRGDSFTTLYPSSTVDAITDIAFNGDTGWIIVSSWGFSSGINKLTKEGVWTHKNGIGLFYSSYPYSGLLREIILDPTNPQKVAYTYGCRGDVQPGCQAFVTKDGGDNWEKTQYSCHFSAIVDNQSFLIGEGPSYNENAKYMYSLDLGTTWDSLGIKPNTLFTNQLYHNFIVGSKDGGVYIGLPNNFSFIGLNDNIITCFSSIHDILYALDTKGHIYKTILSNLPTLSIRSNTKSSILLKQKLKLVLSINQRNNIFLNHNIYSIQGRRILSKKHNRGIYIICDE